ncbi:STAS domain-containing protein [Patescibacteria group bacterium]|nr:STAS domain-containing protein [Patescibacteria group bacterium]
MATSITVTIEDVETQDPEMTVKIVKFVGQLDESNVDEKAQIVYGLISQYPKNLNLILDFDGLEYMNSKSIGYLTDWYGKVFESNGKIIIAKIKPNILDILQVVGLTQLIKTFPTMEEAKFAVLNKTE